MRNRDERRVRQRWLGATMVKGTAMFDNVKRIARPSSADGARDVERTGRMRTATLDNLEPAIELTDAQLDTVVGGVGLVPPRKPSVTYM